MKYYNRCNYNKRVYIGGSLVKGVCRCKRVERIDSYCAGLFDFVMSHYGYDVARLREGRRWKLIDGDVMVFDDEAE